jgi:putative Holliday junction resolvase
MGLDIGDCRIGVALSDPLGIMATPFTIITCEDRAVAIRKIADIIRAKEVEKVIAGMPLNMDGSHGAQADKTEAFVAELKVHTEIPIEYRDERLTTINAKELIQGVRKTNRATRYDAAAAALILQGYLEEMARAKEPPEETDGR